MAATCRRPVAARAGPAGIPAAASGRGTPQAPAAGTAYEVAGRLFCPGPDAPERSGRRSARTGMDAQGAGGERHAALAAATPGPGRLRRRQPGAVREPLARDRIPQCTAAEATASHHAAGACPAGCEPVPRLPIPGFQQRTDTGHAPDSLGRDVGPALRTPEGVRSGRL